jgi:hypothetical protein
VFEEVEEITFALRRTHKVTVNSESTDTGGQVSQPPTGESPTATGRIPSSREERGHRTRRPVGGHRHDPSLPGGAAHDVGGSTLEPAERDRKRELTRRDGPRELRVPDGPRQLPPGK